MEDDFEIVPFGGDFSLVSGDWVHLRDFDMYRRDGRGHGGRRGWKVDPGTVKGLCMALDMGCDRRMASYLVGLPPALLDRWMTIGERVATRWHDHEMRELSDDEEGFLWLWVMVTKHENLWLSKMTLTINEGMSGNESVTDQKMRIALHVMARRSPEAWERKSGLSVNRVPKPELPSLDESMDVGGSFLGSGGTGRVGADRVAREERDRDYELRKSRGTVSGDD